MKCMFSKEIFKKFIFSEQSPNGLVLDEVESVIINSSLPLDCVEIRYGVVLLSNESSNVDLIRFLLVSLKLFANKKWNLLSFCDHKRCNSLAMLEYHHTSSKSLHKCIWLLLGSS